MKKIFKISSLVITACFFVVAADAQVASSSPALTTAQVEALKAPAQRAVTTTATAQTASSAKATTVEAARPAAVKEEAKTTGATTTVATTPVSDQGGVKPVAEAEKATQPVKLPVVSSQGEQPAEKASKRN